MSPTGPSKPALPEKQSPPPRLSSAVLESVRQSERVSMSKRKGYLSTMATRSGDLGVPNIEKQRALGV